MPPRVTTNATSRANKPAKPATKSKAPRKAGASSPKTKPVAETKQRATPAATPAARPIDDRIRSLGDWRGQALAEVRRLIHEADPDVVEECKWVKPSAPSGVPVWSHAGIVCTGEAYKGVIKLTFPRGASLSDPRGLFNSSLEGNTRRAIDIREGDVLDVEAFKALIQAAVAENLRRAASTKSKSPPAAGDRAKPVKLLSGGNPQIAKADGDAPVQAYIAAMPGWKRDLGRRLDALIVQHVPKVRKAVKWNSPFYGAPGDGRRDWFATMHVLTKYVKLTFFKGGSLRPVPPGAGKDKDARWIDVYQHDQLDEAQLAAWVKQAAALPGWDPGQRP